ncbi:MAG TPA: PASTA domain-containing protein [Jatrophihabitans sp.]|nr:PASTA domain-containing protein [Jatrophihabitans sp.]
MSKGKGPWQEARRAWDRLNGWHQDGPSARPHRHADDGEAALTALADVWQVRHLLDQVELAAVKTARRHGKSWAEIATTLGITRQSAWERWRDLDDAEPLAGRVIANVGEQLTERAAHRRRESSVVVPNVIWMPWEQARTVLTDRNLIAVGSDPDGLPLDAMASPGSVVSDQSPESGAKVPRGSTVTLWLDRGEGGVREPRRPTPSPRIGRRQLPEPVEDDRGSLRAFQTGEVQAVKFGSTSAAASSP